MNLTDWFDYQLHSTLEGFIWAVQQLQSERFYSLPPTPLGEWSAAQHIYHMLEYEGKLALPTMYQWLGAPAVVREDDDEKDIQNSPPVEEMLAQFEQIRRAEIELLPQFRDEDWKLIKHTTFWGEVSLYWLVCKTYQHTLEHTHDILRLSLFWDRILERTAQH